MNAMRVLAGIAVVLFALGPRPAAAQTIAPADPARTPGWVFTPSFGASTAWDDNVVLAGVNAPTVGDQITLLTGTADGQFMGRHNTISFGYSGSFSAYRDSDELNSYDQRLRVDTRHTLSRRVGLSFHTGLSIVPTTDMLELSGIPFFRTGSTQQDLRAELSVQVGRRTSVAGGYGFEWVSFEQVPTFSQFLKGGQAHSVFGSLTHQLRERLAVGATVSTRRALVDADGGEFGIADASGTVRYQPTETLSLSGSVGASRLTDSLRQTSQFGPSWGVSVKQQLQRASALLAYARSYVPSFGLGGTLQNQQFDADFQTPIGRSRVSWQAGLSWRRNEPLTPGEPLTSLWLQTSAGYALRRWLRLEAYYSRTQQDSQLRGGRVGRNRFGLQVVTSAPVRFK